MSSHVVAASSPEAPRRGAGATLLRLGVPVAIALVVVVVYARFLAPKPQPLPVLGHVPAMQLTDQAGAPFTEATLNGHVFVADFIFTSCQSTCPGLTKKMKYLEDELAKKGGAAESVRLVSFSVDPETDTPPVLAAYGAKAGANPKVWSFVTGPTGDVRAAVVAGFKVTAEREGANIVHGNWFVLGDAQGNIRGYYEAETEDQVDSIARDAVRLAEGR